MSEMVSPEVQLLIEQKFQAARDEAREETAKARNLAMSVLGAISLIIGFAAYFGIENVVNQQLEIAVEREDNIEGKRDCK